jgi:hypothetical protein
MALEGGYSVRAVSDAVCACVSTLLGEPLPELANEADKLQFTSKR